MNLIEISAAVGAAALISAPALNVAGACAFNFGSGGLNRIPSPQAAETAALVWPAREHKVLAGCPFPEFPPTTRKYPAPGQQVLLWFPTSTAAPAPADAQLPLRLPVTVPPAK